MAQNQITIDLQPRQQQLYNLVEKSSHTDIGYGGARGGGKSHGARSVVLLRRFEHPRTAALIFRRTYGELLTNHINKLWDEYPILRQYYNVADKILRLPPALGGGTIAFGYAENPGDITAFQGQEYMDILVDEATHVTQKEIDFLRTCRRWKGLPDRSCKMILTCNPGGPGHNYIKRVMIDRVFVGNELPEAYAFIPAFGWDNIEWVRWRLKEEGVTAKTYYGWPDERRMHYFLTYSEYGRTLNALPEMLRVQHLMGRWDCFEGQVFPELSQVHNLDSYFDTSDETLWREFCKGFRFVSGIDHATTGITALVQTGIDTDENVFALEEYYKRDRLISEHAQEMRKLMADYGDQEYTVIDPSTEAKTLQNRDEMYSVQDAYARLGINAASAVRSSIAVGLDLMKEYLKVDPLHTHPFKQQKGSPRLFISQRRCPNLWREMAELQCQNDEGKVEYIGDDHATDCLRYIVMSRPAKAELRKRDISQLPTMEQVAVRSMDKFFQKWGREDETGEGSWF